jgi:hypothetical protein
MEKIDFFKPITDIIDTLFVAHYKAGLIMYPEFTGMWF